MAPPSPRPSWTPEMDATLLRMWPHARYLDMAKELNITIWYIKRHAKRLGLLEAPREDRTMPTFQEWHAIASETAQEFGLRPSTILGPAQTSRVCTVRWEAWRRLKASNPRFSLAGIGRTTGFDHTSVRYGLMRLAEGGR